MPVSCNIRSLNENDPITTAVVPTIEKLNFAVQATRFLTLFHMGGGGADTALLQIVFFITSVKDAAEPRNLVTFPKI